MNCIECGLPMATPQRPDDPFVCATCRKAAAQAVVAAKETTREP